MTGFLLNQKQIKFNDLIAIELVLGIVGVNLQLVTIHSVVLDLLRGINGAGGSHVRLLDVESLAGWGYLEVGQGGRSQHAQTRYKMHG